MNSKENITVGPFWLIDPALRRFFSAYYRMPETESKSKVSKVLQMQSPVCMQMAQAPKSQHMM